MALASHHERDENGKSKSASRGDRNAARRVWSRASSLSHLPMFSPLILQRESPAAPSASPGTLELVLSWRCVTGGEGEGPGGVLSGLNEEKCLRYHNQTPYHTKPPPSPASSPALRSVLLKEPPSARIIIVLSPSSIVRQLEAPGTQLNWLKIGLSRGGNV